MAYSSSDVSLPLSFSLLQTSLENDLWKYSRFDSLLLYDFINIVGIFHLMLQHIFCGFHGLSNIHTLSILYATIYNWSSIHSSLCLTYHFTLVMLTTIKGSHSFWICNTRYWSISIKSMVESNPWSITSNIWCSHEWTNHHQFMLTSQFLNLLWTWMVSNSFPRFTISNHTLIITII